TIDISVDSVENIVYSFQASIKVQGEVEVVDNEQKEKITWSDNLSPKKLRSSSQLIALSIFMGGSFLIIPTVAGFLSINIGYNYT
ncbi:hypothetical protein ACTPD5_20830, partial [Clostridioides difficile]